MSDTKHTPGPWHCEGGGYIGIIADVDGRPTQIGRAEAIGCRITDEECEANGALFASAPDLLAACEILADIVDFRCDPDKEHETATECGSVGEFLERAHAAIAKAKAAAQ